MRVKKKDFEKALIDADLTGEQLAEKANVHANTVSNVRRGQAVRVSTATNLATVLGRKLEELFSDDDEAAPAEKAA